MNVSRHQVLFIIVKIPMMPKGVEHPYKVLDEAVYLV
jgi:hypothetical protein